MSAVDRHVVMFSGGIGSWAAARRVADLRGVQDLTLLFVDLFEIGGCGCFVDDAGVMEPAA